MNRLLLCVAVSTLFSGTSEAAEATNFRDATLRAVQFVDANEGWAVGDEGIVWHTIDGGQSWERQLTGVSASLRGVHFLDPFTGFVVGRESIPHGAASAGVVLATYDGGFKWQRLSSKTLPGLNAVRFLDKRNGFAAGDGNDQYGSGLFVTADGGRTWNPVEGKSGPGWLAADFLDTNVGVLVGPWGNIAPVRGQQLGQAGIDSLRGRSIRKVQLQGRTAWAAGDGGMLLVSEDSAGARWGFVDLQLPETVQKCWDFDALHFVGNHGWIAGRPGSVVLHTWDRGKSWQAQNTGQPLPLHGLFFLDERHGWAVGELGTILCTTDGGRSWKVQQRGGHRAAVLVIAAKTEDVPAATIAVLGGDEGYLTAAVQVTCADPASALPGRAGEGSRLAEAMRLAGGCGGEVLQRFALPQHLSQATAAALARAWGGSQDEQRGLDELERQLVLALRIWQPDVVLTENPDPASLGGELGALIAEATTRAFRAAGQADAFPEQIAKLDLQPWSPRKLYAECNAAKESHVTLDLNEARPHAKASAIEYAGPALGLLLEKPVASAPSLARYRLLASRLDAADKHTQLMQGIHLEPGGQARREVAQVDEERWPQIAQAARQRRDLHALARQQIENPGQGLNLLATLDASLVGLSDDQAAETAFALANLFVEHGQWPMANEVFLLMLDRYPKHRLTTDACRWLIQYGGSSEARRRGELGQFRVTTTYQFGLDGEGRVKVDRERQAFLLRRADDIRHWYKSSLIIAEQLAGLSAVHAADPALQFCVCSAHRNLGEFDAAHNGFADLKLRSTTGPWHDAACAELWLENRNGLCPKALASCTRASSPPYLDGNLDDECWKEARPVKLRDAVGNTATEYPTEAWLAYDTEYVYLAVRCRHPSQGHYQVPVSPRQRDAYLRAFDRVSLLLDLDRDYSTYFQFQIDQRGCVCEDCWGDKAWNPKWFVAVRGDSSGWQAEAAIPLVELTGDHVTLGTTWACNLVRTIPGKGVQGLSLPADVIPRPEGMGLLTFIQPDRAQATGK